MRRGRRGGARRGGRGGGGRARRGRRARGGAAARDAAGTRRRLSEMLAGAQTELAQRQSDATAGAAYTIGALRGSAADAIEKVGGQLSDLASDHSNYAGAQA